MSACCRRWRSRWSFPTRWSTKRCRRSSRRREPARSATAASSSSRSNRATGSAPANGATRESHGRTPLLRIVLLAHRERRDRRRLYCRIMPHGSTFVVFVAASIALLLTPGPAVLYIVTRSLDQGRLVGLVSVLGIWTGTMVHVVAATLGLSALLVSSALAFTAVRYAGAVYLVVLGIQALLRREPPPTDTTIQPTALRPVFPHRVALNILNPH